MKTITIRGIDSTLDKALKEAAQQNGSSVNQIVVEALKEYFDLSKTPKYTRRHHDLDHLFGKWSAEEYQQVQNAIDEQRPIDPELWS